MLVLVSLAAFALAGVVLTVLVHRHGHDDFAPSIEAFSDFRAALARSDSPLTAR